jgi:hypothetical protein
MVTTFKGLAATVPLPVSELRLAFPRYILAAFNGSQYPQAALSIGIGIARLGFTVSTGLKHIRDAAVRL